METQTHTDSEIIKLRGASQITLPLGLRKAAQLSEGDYLEAVLREDGILLRPVTINPRDPTPEQAQEIMNVVNDVRAEYAKERRH